MPSSAGATGSGFVNASATSSEAPRASGSASRRSILRVDTSTFFCGEPGEMESNAGCSGSAAHCVEEAVERRLLRALPCDLQRLLLPHGCRRRFARAVAGQKRVHFRVLAHPCQLRAAGKRTRAPPASP